MTNKYVRAILRLTGNVIGWTVMLSLFLLGTITVGFMYELWKYLMDKIEELVEFLVEYS